MEPPSPVSLKWLQKERLKAKNLKVSFFHLLKREEMEWQPLFFTGKGTVGEVNHCERHEALRNVWKTACLLHWGMETRFSAASILDDVLKKVRVTPRLLNAVADTALLIAAKISEEDDRVGSIASIAKAAGMSVGVGELIRMERLLLDKMDWHPKSSLALEILQTTHALALVEGEVTAAGNSPYQEFRFGCCSASEELSALTKMLWNVIKNAKSALIKPSLLALSLVTLERNLGEGGHSTATEKESTLQWLISAVRVSLSEFCLIRSLVISLLPSSIFPVRGYVGHWDRNYGADRLLMNNASEHSQSLEKVSLSMKPRCYEFTEVLKASPSLKAESCVASSSSPYQRTMEAAGELAVRVPLPILSPLLRPPQKSLRMSDVKKKRRPTAGFRAKGRLRGLIRSSLKVSSNISLVSRVNAGGGVSESSSPELGLPSQDSDTVNDSSPSFSANSPEFPGIEDQNRVFLGKKGRDKNGGIHESKSPNCGASYEKLTYAQVLRLHLAPLKHIMVA